MNADFMSTFISANFRFMRFRRIVGITCILSMLIGLIFVANRALIGLDDAYAQWGASEMLIDYMEAHDGRWPTKWEDLQDEFGRRQGRVGGTFADFQKRISIDFHADPLELRKLSVASDHAQFQVVRAHWYSAKMGEGPNAMIRQYFRHKEGIVDASPLNLTRPSNQSIQIAAETRLRARGALLDCDGDGNIVAIVMSQTSRRVFDDGDLSHLSQFNRLRTLDLSGSKVTDVGLHYLKYISTLKDLNLANTRATDAGLKELCQLPNLVRLDLYGTQITDLGLGHIQDLPHLQSLRIDETAFGKKALNDLRLRRPTIEIDCSYDTLRFSKNNIKGQE